MHDRTCIVGATTYIFCQYLRSHQFKHTSALDSYYRIQVTFIMYAASQLYS